MEAENPMPWIRGSHPLLQVSASGSAVAFQVADIGVLRGCSAG